MATAGVKEASANEVRRIENNSVINARNLEEVSFALTRLDNLCFNKVT